MVAQPSHVQCGRRERKGKVKTDGWGLQQSGGLHASTLSHDNLAKQAEQHTVEILVIPER